MTPDRGARKCWSKPAIKVAGLKDATHGAGMMGSDMMSQQIGVMVMMGS